MATSLVKRRAQQRAWRQRNKRYHRRWARAWRSVPENYAHERLLDKFRGLMKQGVEVAAEMHEAELWRKR